MKIKVIDAPEGAAFTEDQEYEVYGNPESYFVFDDNVESYFLSDLDFINNY